MRIAKTYESSNGWTIPISISKFGIPISLPDKRLELFLGLEEFNFSNVLKKLKLAYIPCFSAKNAGIKDETIYDNIDLFYLENSSGITYHYATMKGVQRISESEIDNIRLSLNVEEFPHLVASDRVFEENYGELFPIAIEKWNIFYNSNNITARDTDPRFILNVRYTDLIILHPKKVKPWKDFRYASRLYYYSQSIDEILSVSGL